MLIRELFSKAIDRPINGVVKADQVDDDVRHIELEEYVITKEMAQHFAAFFDVYMPSVTDPKAKAATGKMGIWVSGFFGSGKSHFIKILSYLLDNNAVASAKGKKAPVEFFKDKGKLDGFLLGEIDKAVAKKNQVILFNIDSRANTDEGDDAILKVFLKVFNEQMGYSGDHPHIANLERELAQRGVFEKFKQIFADLTSMDWVQERDAYDFYRDDLADALGQVTNQSQASARQWVEQMETNFSLDVANFCKWVKEYLDEDFDRRVLFFVDEVGQFVGNKPNMMLKLQTITENLGTICEGRAWIVVTSQEDIDAVIDHMKGTKSHDFSKIQGRFERLSLSSANTSEVIEARLLAKEEAAHYELQKLYDQKGDILRNQLTFDDQITAELASYKDANSFIRSYPFVPYHYNLVQKIFEAIRAAGQTGLHLSRGERSLLDAFQSAACTVKEEDVGVLIPLYYFYPAIESFLDTAVKRSINETDDKDSISPFAKEILKTLFLVRYVDEIKSTLDNLVTLCVTKVDEDKLTLRREIEKALESLERNGLIARRAGEYVFLTNEEKEIENEIRNTELESSDETKKLSDMIFDEILRRENIYRYPENKQDFPISRFCNGLPRDGAQETDLVVKVISPIDPNYSEYDATMCANHSAYDNGSIVIKLANNSRVFEQIRTYIKTEKFLRRSTGNRPGQVDQIAKKGYENQQLNREIKEQFTELLKDGEFYALGMAQNPKGGSVDTILRQMYKYVIENTFNKLKLVTPYTGDIRLEILHTLQADDVSQKGLDLTAEEVNPQAIAEVEKFIALADETGRPINAEDIVRRFAKRPFGWNTDEIMLIMARLGLGNKICFQMRQQEVPLKSVFDNLIQVRRRADLRIRRIKQQSEANLKRAAKIYKDAFRHNAPDTEKELFNCAIEQLGQMKEKLNRFGNIAATGHYPGQTAIEEGKVLLAGLLDGTSSFQFIEQLLACGNDLLDYDEDFHELEHFYDNQFSAWQKLHKALTISFDRNRNALEKDATAQAALSKLEAIYNNPRPYREIRHIEPLIEQVSQVNQNLLSTARAQASETIEQSIARVKNQVEQVKASDELSNEALRSLQLALQRLDSMVSIAEVQQEQADAAYFEEDAYELINRHIERLQAEAKAKAEQQRQQSHDETDQAYPPQKAPGMPIAEPAPKKIVTLDLAAVLAEVNSDRVIATAQDIDNYLALLKSKLTDLVNSDNKVRLK